MYRVLFLDLSFYKAYNRKQSQLKSPSLLEDWDERERQERAEQEQEHTDGPKSNPTSEDGYRRWKAFKQDVILPHLANEEWEQGNFLKYLLQQEFFFDHVAHYKLDSPPQQP